MSTTPWCGTVEQRSSRESVYRVEYNLLFAFLHHEKVPVRIYLLNADGLLG